MPYLDFSRKISWTRSPELDLGPIPFLCFISKLPLKASTLSPKMSPTPDPNLGRRQKMTPYSTLGRRFGGVFSKFSERLQIGCLLVG